MEDLRKTRGDRKGRIAIRSSSLDCRRRAVQGLRVVTSNMGSRSVGRTSGDDVPPAALYAPPGGKASRLHTTFINIIMAGFETE
jgi:hypothetical protein